MKTSRITAVALLGLSILNPQLSTGLAQGTAFTYQGRLVDGSNPADGNYDFRFTIWNAENGPSLVSGTIGTNALAVSNGLFTATLDFGSDIFTGADRWLEINVRTNSGGSFATLSPRQKLTATPYAVTAGNVVSGGLAAGAYGNAFVFSNSGNSFAGSFAGNGGGLSNVNAAALGGIASSNFWRLGGNTYNPFAILGTLDIQPLAIIAGNRRVFQAETASRAIFFNTQISPNLLGGSEVNTISNGVIGATIAGGGLFVRGLFGPPFPSPNVVSDDFGMIGGGFNNVVGNGNADASDAIAATVGGGEMNIASGSHSTIGGGANNTIRAASTSAVIGGGHENLIAASALDATISGGALNNVTGPGGTIGGGGNNAVSNYNGTVSGGANNRAGGNAATIGGGEMNIASASHSTIGGGASNTIQAASTSAVIGGGHDNLIAAGALDATISGGALNSVTVAGVSGSYATVSGGLQNTSGGYGAVVGGGSYNTASADFATVGGGVENAATALYGALGGGIQNVNAGYAATVSGGQNNHVSDFYATVAGGAGNTASRSYATVGGGLLNVASGSGAIVSGGVYNTNSGTFATVAGGSNNFASGYAATVGGGYRNANSGYAATVSGGYGNSSSADYGSVGGGVLNTVTGFYGTVAGGVQNNTGYGAVAGGGQNNIASGFFATISGGSYNTNSGQFATVGGGYQNMASGNYAMIPGGFRNFATDYSFAAGRRAKAVLQGSFVWADSNDFDFSGNVANKVRFRCTSGFDIITAIDGSGNQTAGTFLPPGGSSWLMISDRNAKENFQPVNGQEVLAKVAALPLTTWKYKSQPEGIRHIGVMAQDFHEAFHLGEDERCINTLDADGVALAAIQGLNQKLEEQIATQKVELEAKDTRISELERRLAAVEKLISGERQIPERR